MGALALALAACEPAAPPPLRVDATTLDATALDATALDASRPDALDGSAAAADSRAADADASGRDAAPEAPVCAPDAGAVAGSVTWYYLDQGPWYEVHCGFPVVGRNPDDLGAVATGDGLFFGAISSLDYADAAVCGGCVEIARDDGRSVVVTIADSCPVATNPKCVRGHIDLSKAAFAELGDLSEGYLGTDNGGAVGRISYRWVACPVGAGALTARLKEPANPHWNEVIIEGGRYRIARVDLEVDGTWVAAERQHYNFWRPPGGDLGRPPYGVRVTDVNGAVVEGALALAPGAQPLGGAEPLCLEPPDPTDPTTP